ncbi:MAG: hypothetical protein CL517_01045 [Actinobacteria bacterium]|nr:hypothetical protein [Actinomycetota bacterium]MEC7810540.1 hypothetical protein [Actinomycetota bacterium]MED5276671.1 hypothetical protein [Actinomycetota bacterium]|tara:strand:- start:9611 stop:9958 length:348 start_codon:yes stop_codon:yes gene_type:complete
MSEVHKFPTRRSSTSFAHESEEKIAQLLDFYEIKWEYEPTTFVLERDSKGQPRSAFTPDFYLPEHNLYLEVTTLKQSLVTRKNRKVRRLQAQRPDLSIRILYRSDIERLFLSDAA